jgi:putative salt-induced outer membrane protein YdiY
MNKWTLRSMLPKLLCLLFLFGATWAMAKRKDDVVIMSNGDMFTGEIKELEHGELVFKSDYMKDSVHLDWKRVKSLRSKDVFIVAFSDGRRVTGTIAKHAEAHTNEGRDFSVISAEVPVEVQALDVIRVQPQELSFWNQLTGSINYGFSFTGGNSRTVSSSLGASVGFNNEKNAIRVATSSQFDSQDRSSNTNRVTFDSEYLHALNTRWVAEGLVSLLKSNQQDLKLRSTYGGGLGRRLIQTDRTSMLAIAGAAFSHETYAAPPGPDLVRSNAEGLLGLTFNTFRFKTLNFNSQAFLFCSLNDPGRVRLSSQSNLRIELVRNFNWNLQLYENYDTRPPVTAPKNDLGITTSVGWTF